MNKPQSLLLWIDAIVNLLLGILLLAYSLPLAQALGVPGAAQRFYPTLLGAVLFGIGIALAMEARRSSGGLIGLGLGGAVAINLSAGVVLAVWLLSGALQPPLRGLVLLWALVVLLVGLSLFELLAHGRK